MLNYCLAFTLAKRVGHFDANALLGLLANVSIF